MSASLISRLVKAREFAIPVDGIKFLARRPTDVEAVALHRGNADFQAIAVQFVIGWSGVKESDIIANGGDEAVSFNADLWREWCADSPRFWAPIANAVLQEYQTHAAKLEDAAKN